jgi:hypothetical protein
VSVTQVTGSCRLLGELRSKHFTCSHILYLLPRLLLSAQSISNQSPDSRFRFILPKMACPHYNTRSPLTLLDLPTEIHNEIITWLRFPDPLRVTTGYFYDLLPKSHFSTLLAAETSEFGITRDLLACSECARLRPAVRFAREMQTVHKSRNGSQAYIRFCIECGTRNGPGMVRYRTGKRWTDNGVPYIRCAGCGTCGKAPFDKSIKRCVECWAFCIEHRGLVVRPMRTKR